MSDNQPSGWAVGWTAFAGIMMIMMGGWWIISGLVAIIDDQFYIVTQEWIFRFDLTLWGWIHLILGIVILASGIGLFSGATWARIVGVILNGVKTRAGGYFKRQYREFYDYSSEEPVPAELPGPPPAPQSGPQDAT